MSTIHVYLSILLPIVLLIVLHLQMARSFGTSTHPVHKLYMKNYLMPQSRVNILAKTLIYSRYPLLTPLISTPLFPSFHIFSHIFVLFCLFVPNFCLSFVAKNLYFFQISCTFPLIFLLIFKLSLFLHTILYQFYASLVVLRNKF